MRTEPGAIMPCARLALLTAGLAISLPATSTAQWPPEKLENLKVLPDTMPVRQLIDLMAGFTRALGVRCTHCHVGEENQPLETYDFPSDEKPAKRKAREMLRMVQAINGEHLTGLEERQDPPVQVQCITCHHGVTAPRTLQDVLLLAYQAGGLDSTLTTYNALRRRYYGSAAYDFGEVPLTDVAGTVARRGRLDDAVRLHALNVEQNPESRFAKQQHGRIALLQAFTTLGLDSGLARYQTLRAQYGPAAFPEFALNDLGYALLGRNKTAEAIAVFRLNVEGFPRSANAHDSLGEAYAAAGDTTRAIASYQRSLELDSTNANATKRLDALRARR
jgi:tetratricopeptide (TPR) repeat protein